MVTEVQFLLNMLDVMFFTGLTGALLSGTGVFGMFLCLAPRPAVTE